MSNNDIPKLGRPEKKGKPFWGPPIWSTIHIMAASYKPSAAFSFKAFLEALPDLLPCPSCGEHLRKNLEEHPPDKYMRNNHDLFFWTYVLHDTVNSQCNSVMSPNDKKKVSPAFDDAKRYYFSGLGEECKICQL